MNFGLAFSFPFQDQEWWKKFLLMGVITLIPVVGQFVLMGWVVQLVRNVINDDPTPIPSLDFGGQLGQGFKFFILALVYMLPVIILTLPIYIITPIADAAGMDSDTLGIMMAVVSCLCGGLALILGLAAAFLIPAGVANMVINDSLGAGLRVGEVFGLVKAAPVAYLIVIVGSIVASLIGSLGTLGCGIGVLLTMPYAQAITGHFYAQAYKQAVEAKGSTY
ncbi:MAG: DUF4013 domain-containing protein [Anaerolineaceae bacterium]|nr:DUF4013 domain-containing protein [Anaerolineaceae bacterium]